MKRFWLLLLVAALLVSCTPSVQTENDTPPPPDTSLHFDGDFTVQGEYAETLIAALSAAGISVGTEGSEKIIYAGEHERASTAARENATAREACYNDFSIVCNGNSLSLYGGSAHATEQAIAYLITHYAKEGKITVKNDLSYTNAPTLSALTAAGKPIAEMTVVAEEASCLSIAKELAHRLSVASGHEIPYAQKASGAAIRLAAMNTDSELLFSEDYSFAADEAGLSLQAKTRASLSFAAEDFAARLTGGTTFAAGESGNLHCELQMTSARDTALFKYFGMWEPEDRGGTDCMVSYWNVAYVEIDFTGNALLLHFSSPTNFIYSIDGGAYSEPQSATSQAAIFAEGEGKHTLRVRNRATSGTGRSGHLYFAGVSATASATLSRTADRAHYIQFVGDSISDGSLTFAYRVGEALGWDFSVTSCEAMGVRRNYGWWFVNNGYKDGAYTDGSMARLILDNFGVKTLGMEDAFFKLGLAENVMVGEERELYAEHYLDAEGTLECSFASGNTPDIVFIFLGTNDQLTTETNFDSFVSAYVSFVGRILETYGPDTQICIMNALSHSVPPEQNDENNGRYVGIRQAAHAILDRFTENVFFIDREDIISWNVEIGRDNVHPTGKGQDTLTEKISEYLSELYG